MIASEKVFAKKAQVEIEITVNFRLAKLNDDFLHGRVWNIVEVKKARKKEGTMTCDDIN